MYLLASIVTNRQLNWTDFWFNFAGKSIFQFSVVSSRKNNFRCHTHDRWQWLHIFKMRWGRFKMPEGILGKYWKSSIKIDTSCSKMVRVSSNVIILVFISGISYEIPRQKLRQFYLENKSYLKLFWIQTLYVHSQFQQKWHVAIKFIINHHNSFSPQMILWNVLLIKSI